MDTVTFRISDPGPAVAESPWLKEIVDWTLSPVFCDAGSVQITYVAGTTIANYIVSELDNDRPVEIYPHFDGQVSPRLGFIIEEYDGSLLEDNETWSFTGRFNVAMLEWARLAQRPENNVPDPATWRMVNSTAGQYVHRLMFEAHGGVDATRNTIPEIGMDGRWTDFVDSHGNPWAFNLSLDVAVGVDYLSFLKKLYELRICEFQITEILGEKKLQLYNPADMTVTRTGPLVQQRFWNDMAVQGLINEAKDYEALEKAVDEFETTYDVDYHIVETAGEFQTWGTEYKWDAIDDGYIEHIKNVTRIVVREFSKYPPEMVKNSQLGDIWLEWNLRRKEDDGFVHSNSDVINFNVNSNQPNLDNFTAAFHSEWMKILWRDPENQTIWNNNFNARWHAQNPEGFEYSPTEYSADDFPKPYRFISSYARTGLDNDIGETNRFMNYSRDYQQGLAFASIDPPLQEKIRIYHEFMARLDPFYTDYKAFERINIGMQTGVGIDRTIGNSVVTLRQGRDLVDAPRKRTTRGVATDLLMVGSEGAYATTYDESARARMGRRREAVINEAAITDRNALMSYGQTKLSTLTQGRSETTLGLVMEGQFTPGEHFDIGDWVDVDMRTDGSPVEKMRIVQWSLSGDADGLLSGSVTLNDFFADRDEILNQRIDDLIEGSTVTGASRQVGLPNDVVDGLAPARPEGLSITSTPFMNVVGDGQAMVRGVWLPVQTNSDGTPITDLGGYEVAWQADIGGQVQPWLYVGQTSTTFMDFGPVPSNYYIRIRVRAFDNAGNKSPWSVSTLARTVSDSTPPAQPSAPSLEAFLGVVIIRWNGLDLNGAPMAADFDHLEVHVSTEYGFTPTAATLIDSIPGNGPGVATYSGEPNVTVYVRLVAVDRSGNRSQRSTFSTVRPTKLVSDDLIDDIITSAKIARGAIDDPNFLGDEVVEASKIRNLAVGNAHIAWAAISSGKIENLAVVTAKIADLAVNDAKIMNLQVGKILAGEMKAAVSIAGRMITGETNNGVEMNAQGLFGRKNGVNWLTFTNTGISIYRGEFRAETFFTAGYVTGGRSYIALGNTGTNDPADELRMFMDGRVASIRNPSDSPGALRISTNDNSGSGIQTAEFRSAGFYVNSNYKWANRNSHAGSGSPRTWYGTHIKDTDHYFAVQYPGMDFNTALRMWPTDWAQWGNRNMMISNFNPTGGGLKYLGLEKQVHVRAADDSQYGDMKLRNIYADNIGTSSNPALKKNVKKLDIDAVSMIEHMNLYAWDWDETQERTGSGIGFMLDEIPSMAEIVTEDEDTFSLPTMMALTLRVGQQNSSEIALLRKEIEALKGKDKTEK